MQHSEAVRHLAHMLIAVQRARSIQMESIARHTGLPADDEINQYILRLIGKFIFDGKAGVGCLYALQTVIDRIENGGVLDPTEFFNFMVAAKMQPLIQITALGWSCNEQPLPEPDIDWIRNGWESEDSKGELI